MTSKDEKEASALTHTKSQKLSETSKKEKKEKEFNSTREKLLRFNPLASLIDPSITIVNKATPTSKFGKILFFICLIKQKGFEKHGTPLDNSNKEQGFYSYDIIPKMTSILSNLFLKGKLQSKEVIETIKQSFPLQREDNPAGVFIF